MDTWQTRRVNNLRDPSNTLTPYYLTSLSPSPLGTVPAPLPPAPLSTPWAMALFGGRCKTDIFTRLSASEAFVGVSHRSSGECRGVLGRYFPPRSSGCVLIPCCPPLPASCTTSVSPSLFLSISECPCHVPLLYACSYPQFDVLLLYLHASTCPCPYFGSG